jgi:hypothetical protein
MNRDTVSAKEVGELLAFGRTAAQATHRIRHWTNTGILTPIGREPGGKTAAHVYDKAVAAIACVLFWLHDRAGLPATGVASSGHLRGIFVMFSKARPGADRPLIDAVLQDIESDGSPVMVVTQWINPEGETGHTFEVRLTDELDRPIIAPGDEWQPIFDGVLSLSPLLTPFLERTIVPFRQREAS